MPPEARRLLKRSFARTVVTVVLLIVTNTAHAWSQDQTPSQGTDNAVPAFLKDVGIDQHLDAQVPADLVVRDESGRDVPLGSYFGKRPMVLVLAYYKCPRLCTTVLNELCGCFNAMPISIGEQFDVVTVSFDPRENDQHGLAAEKKKQYLRQYARPHGAEGWHFLTADEANIKRLTSTVGFRYVFDPKSDQYVHASGITVLTPQGKISRYFYGIDYAPRDLRMALVEASENKTGSLANVILLFCYHYDPSTGKYTLAVLNLLKVGALVTMLGVGMLIYRGVRHPTAKPQADAAAGSTTGVPSENPRV